MDRIFKRENRFALIGLSVLFFLFLVRLPLLSRMMTHVDDIGPLVDLLKNPHSSPLWGPVIVSRKNWTYAPFQFFFTDSFLRFASDYSSTLFWGRLPSLLLWWIGCSVGWILSLRIFRDERWIAVLLTAFLAFSWRGWIESSQAHNYASTLISAIALTWIFATDAGRRLPPTLAGVLAGSLCWLTYQALFVAAAAFLGTGTLALLRRDFDRVRKLAVSCLAFLVPFVGIYLFSLKYLTSKGVPGWADGIPASDLTSRLFLLPGAWFGVIQNITSFLPWGVGTQIVAALTLMIIVVGTLKWVSSPNKTTSDRVLLSFVLGCAVIWTVGGVLRAFPLSTTRHTYILQFPCLLWLGLSLRWLGIRTKPLLAVTSLVSVLFVFWLPSQLRRIENRVGIDEVIRLAEQVPNAKILSLPDGATLDPMLLIRSKPEIPKRFYAGDRWPEALSGSSSWILLSHRSPISTEMRNELARYGLTSVTTLTEIPPVGSPELHGFPNGGNGFYLYRAESPRP